MSVNLMSEDEVKKIASLVKLELSADEINKLCVFMPQTLETIEILKELNTQDVPPTNSVTGLINVFQDEDLRSHPALTQEEALSNAAIVINGLFATAAVISK